jgi:hypothetical protein
VGGFIAQPDIDAPRRWVTISLPNNRAFVGSWVERFARQTVVAAGISFIDGNGGKTSLISVMFYGCSGVVGTSLPHAAQCTSLIVAPTTSLLADVHSGLMKIPAFHPEITQQMAVVHQSLGNYMFDFAFALPYPIHR